VIKFQLTVFPSKGVPHSAVLSLHPYGSPSVHSPKAATLRLNSSGASVLFVKFTQLPSCRAGIVITPAFTAGASALLPVTHGGWPQSVRLQVFRIGRLFAAGTFTDLIISVVS